MELRGYYECRAIRVGATEPPHPLHELFRLLLFPLAEDCQRKGSRMKGCEHLFQTHDGG